MQRPWKLYLSREGTSDPVLQAQHETRSPDAPAVQHVVENAMDTCPNRCSILSMWKFLGALLLFATPALAQEKATAYEALRVVGAELGRGALSHVVSITGVKGDPQPEKWKIILEDPDGRGLRKVEVADGKIDSKHLQDRSVAGSAEGAT